MGKDVTTLFDTYRECARHIRNTYFSSIESQDRDIVEDFDEVDRVLFQRLVLYRVTEAYDPALDRAVEENHFLIIPNGDRMPLMVARDKTPGYWDHPVQYLERGDAQIAFREYWDWDEHAFVFQTPL